MCDCIEQIQKALKELDVNTQLDIPFVLNEKTHSWDSNKVAVAVCKMDEKKRKRPAVIVSSYCPFCGEKYAKEIEVVK